MPASVSRWNHADCRQQNMCVMHSSGLSCIITRISSLRIISGDSTLPHLGSLCPLPWIWSSARPKWQDRWSWKDVLERLLASWKLWKGMRIVQIRQLPKPCKQWLRSCFCIPFFQSLLAQDETEHSILAWKTVQWLMKRHG